MWGRGVCYPQSNWAPGGGLVHTLGPCGSLQQILLQGWEFLLLPPQPPWVFSIRGWRLYFPALEPWVAGSASLPHCSSWFIYTQMWGPRGHQPPPCGVCQLQPACPIPQSVTSLGLPATTLLRVLATRLLISTPPTGLDECFFFISLVVRLPYSSIFWHFWLFFVFKLLLSFFWLYLCLRLGQNYLLSF